MPRSRWRTWGIGVIASPQQAVHLQNVKTAIDALRRAKRDAGARARLIASEEIQSYQNAADHEVRLAFEAGVPKRQLRMEGMGTSDAKTLDDSLKRTEAAMGSISALIEAEAVDAGMAYKWDRSREHVTITLSGETLAAACAKDGWDVADVSGGEFASATFTLETGWSGPVLRFQDPTMKWGWVGAPHYKSHPVVFWMMNIERETAAITSRPS